MRILPRTAYPRVALAAALIGAAALAGCDANGTAGTSASPSMAPQPSSSAVSLSPEVAANTQTVCTDVKKIITDNSVEFSKQIVSAVSQAESDQTKAIAAIKQVKALQPQLKAALATEAASFDTAAAKINTVDDLKNAGTLLSGNDVAQAGQQVQEACGAYWLR